MTQPDSPRGEVKSVAHQFRGNGNHYNGGAKFFGYGFHAIGEPRLKMIRRWYRQGAQRGQSEDHFFVDGARVESYDAAVLALKTPAVLTAEDRPLLALFTDEPKRRPDGDIQVLLGLRDKAFIRVQDGLYSLTDAGRAALKATERSDG